MALTLDDLLDGVRSSRKFFLRHLDGLRDEQYDWKPYLECKSIRETLVHMVTNDRAALQSLETGHEPDYDSLIVQETDIAHLRALLDESHEKLCSYIKTRYADAPLDTVISSWGSEQKLGRGVAHFSSEDYYHAGQVGYIRQATDPTWDYYGFIYGSE